MKKRNSDAGFTLMEMVVAVLVVAIMTAIVMPHLLGAGKRAQAEACGQNQREIRAALIEYDLEHGNYPVGSSIEQLQSLVSDQVLDSIPIEPDGGNYIITDTNTSNVIVSCSIHGTIGNTP